MDKPTIQQANEVLRLIGQHLDRQKLQNLLDIGLLTDLFSAIDFPTVDRAGFRASLFRPKAMAPFYRVSVDYRLTLRAMIDAGLYDRVNDSINAERFHFRHREPEEVDICLVPATDRSEITARLLAKLDRMGLRPATLPELLSLGSTHPDLQWHFSITALGSSLEQDGNRYFPSINFTEDLRGLALDFDDNSRWENGHRFAAVRT